MKVTHLLFFLRMNPSLVEVVVLNKGVSQAHLSSILRKFGSLTGALEAFKVIEHVSRLIKELLIPFQMTCEGLKDI